jgi:hypothetical protein
VRAPTEIVCDIVLAISLLPSFLISMNISLLLYIIKLAVLVLEIGFHPTFEKKATTFIQSSELTET